MTQNQHLEKITNNKILVIVIMLKTNNLDHNDGLEDDQINTCEQNQKRDHDRNSNRSSDRDLDRDHDHDSDRCHDRNCHRD